MNSTNDYDTIVSRAIDAGNWCESEAARAEVRKAGPSALPAIERVFSDKRWKARRVAAQMLDDALDDTNVHVLMRALKDPNAIVRRNALHSLACVRCKPVGCWNVDITGTFINIVLNDSPRVRSRALVYLSCRPPEARSVEALRHLIATHQHPVVLQRARTALARIERAFAAVPKAAIAAGSNS